MIEDDPLSLAQARLNLQSAQDFYAVKKDAPSWQRFRQALSAYTRALEDKEKERHQRLKKNLSF
ncbi:hypothetical protein Cva_01639 [Caedimonas varicaedens]|uniref:Uncharacterized protein n=1 Tax=Caedimonas varicaedens TaxID=1629334 RepID=A0A0K8MGI1_9PROT|nr:hypothetical protein Cva_01639 [Caedimonas varicaedens]